MNKTLTVKSTNWLSEGFSTEQIHEIKNLALIGAKIQEKRFSLGLTQKDFAKLMHVSQGMVSRWESGDYNFTISTLEEICSKLDLDFSPTITDRVVHTPNNPVFV